jgi:peptidoglycan/LPS O-acetylase OafA/YrhL
MDGLHDNWQTRRKRSAICDSPATHDEITGASGGGGLNERGPPLEFRLRQPSRRDRAAHGPRRDAWNEDRRAPAHVPAFDWLRFVLALVVLLDHGGAFGVDSRLGSLAVHVFFVLSGWLIGGILQSTSRQELPRFFYNRALRIWIPYYIALAILLTLSLARGDFSVEWAKIVALKLAMVYNLFSGFEVMAGFPHAPLLGTGHHLWSVNAEEQFYLGAPLLLVVAHRWGRSPAVWALIALAFLFVGTDYPGLSLGVLASIVLRDRVWHQGPSLAPGRPKPLTAPSGGSERSERGGLEARVVLVVLLLATIPLLLNDATFIRAAPFFGLAVVLLLSAPGSASRLGVVLGGMSYPLYLNHWIGLFAANFLTKRLGLERPLQLGVAVVVSLCLCWLHYQFIDRMIRERRAQWYTPRAGNTLMFGAYAIFAIGLAYGFATVGRIV